MESLKTPECSPGPFGVGENNTDSFSRIATDSALESIQQAGIYRRIVEWLSHSGIETNGITPVPPDQRTDTRLYQMYFVWFTANANILTSATVGPVFFGLGMRDAMLMVIGVDIIACAFPAFFAVFGPKLGTRAMVQARFSWGYYGAIIPSILNVVTSQGYLTINCIVGGQTLATVSDQLTNTLGIVIIGLISLAITFCGCRAIHLYESIAWIPNVIAFIVMLGVGGKHLINSPPSSSTRTPASVFLTFGTTLGATIASWSTGTPDQGVYHDAKASTWRIFIYIYLGFFFGTLPIHLIGVAFASAATSVPAWRAGLGNGNNVGGLIAAILSPTGGFGKFLLVLTSLTVPSACAPTIYSFCTSLMTIAPFFARIPRYVIAIISTIILIPLAILGDRRFYSVFVQLLSLMGYWIAPFIGIVLTEHVLFRSISWSRYDVDAWDKPHKLPRGYAAIITFVASIGVIVPCMDQEWWIGPVARAGTGDIGMLVGLVSSVLFYSPLRWIEIQWATRRC